MSHYAKTVNEMCAKYHCNWGIEGWAESHIDDLLADFHPSPKSLAGEGLFEKILWLVDICEPPFSLEQIEDYFVDCMQP